MQLDVLREYVCLAKTLNYHTAAKELHITQPTLSNHISALEKELSFSLIDRSHGIRLTEAGAAFLEWAAGMIVSYDEALGKCKTISKRERLSFSVQIRQPIDHATATFIECVRRFKESHPQASIKMLPARDKFVLDELQNGYCDCSIFIQQVTPPQIDPIYQGLSMAPLCQDEAIAWMHKNNPLAQKPNLSLQDLTGSLIPIHVNDNARIWEMAVNDDFQAQGLKPSLSYRYAASAEEFVLQQLKDSDVLLLPKGYLNSPLYQLRDDRIAVSFSPKVLVTCYVVYREDASKSALQEFVSYINETYHTSVASGTPNA